MSAPADNEIDEDPIVKRTVRAGAKLDVPTGVANSPFDIARTFLSGRKGAGQVGAGGTDGEGTAPAAEPKRQQGRIPRVPAIARAAQLLARGPLTVVELALALGLDLKKARILACNGVQLGRWRRETIGDQKKLVLVDAQAKRAAPEPTKAPRRARKTAQAAQPKARQRGAACVAVEAAVPPSPAAPAVDEGVFGLFSTGELRIEYGGVEMRLPRKVTKNLVAYLDKLATAMEE